MIGLTLLGREGLGIQLIFLDYLERDDEGYELPHEAYDLPDVVFRDLIHYEFGLAHEIIWNNLNHLLLNSCAITNHDSEGLIA